MLAAFAHHIVPVSLRVMGILEYPAAVDDSIKALEPIARDSALQVELRACCVFAIARLTHEINSRRKGMTPLSMPQVDFRFWKSYHATDWPHHLTKTII
jgi:hypothetical protein